MPERPIPQNQEASSAPTDAGFVRGVWNDPAIRPPEQMTPAEKAAYWQHRQIHVGHPAGEATAAGLICREIRRMVPGWKVRAVAMSWIAEDPDGDSDRGVVVATAQIVGLLSHPPAGPIVIGTARGVEVRVVLPRTVDGGDIGATLNALTAMGVLPPEAPR